MARPQLSEDDKGWMRSVVYFWEDKGDPTCFIDWDEARCERLMPSFLAAWRAYKVAEDTLNRLAKSYAQEAW